MTVKLTQVLRRPWLACLIICVLVLALVLAIRSQGLLQRPELLLYDELVKLGPFEPPDNRIVICGMTEDDLIKYGHPISDVKLAEVLEKLAAAKPCAIGIDLYRDLPEPRSGEGAETLAKTLQQLETVVAIGRLKPPELRQESGSPFQVEPPPALADRSDRIVANNVPIDHHVDDLYRRGVMFFEDGLSESIESLAFSLVHYYLDAHQIELGFEKSSDGGPLLRLGKTVIPRLTKDAGGYASINVADYEFLIDYRVTPQFPTFSFGDILEGGVPKSMIDGAIVLVAMTAPSVKDENPTPINEKLRGVTQHAMIANQLLRAAFNGKAPMSWWPEPGEIGWIALWTLAGGGIALGLRSPWRLAPASGLLIAVIFGVGWLAFSRGIWIPIAAPMLSSLLAAALVTSFLVYLERSERALMKTLFSRHVSSSVVDALWAARDSFLEGGRLKPQRLTATVLFTDLKGFSTTSEGMDPEALMNWMNEYMNGIARHVESHGGIITTYIGDAIMGVFGPPRVRRSEEEFNEDATNAVKCALAMRADLARLNSGWRERGLPTTSMRVGIYTGPLVAGSLGSQDRLEFTVLGDTVNTAARLESAGKDVAGGVPVECMILIGDSTARRLNGRFVTECLGPISLKGKSEQIIVHTVLSEKPEAE